MSRVPLKENCGSRAMGFRLSEDELAEFERLLDVVGKSKTEVLRPLVQKWIRQVRETQRRRK